MTRVSTPGSAAATSEKQETTRDVVPGDVVPGDVVPGDVVPGDVVKAEADMAYSVPQLERFGANAIPGP
jgi:hypothetical protein